MIEILNLRKIKPDEKYDVIVDRRSILGNPFILTNESKRDEVCDDYDMYFCHKIENDKKFKDELDRIISIYVKYGKLRLFCWCAPKRCHSEIIKRYIECECK